MAVVELLEQEDTDEVVDLPPKAEDTTQTASQELDDDLPEKYRGKSVKEIVSMHQEAEKVIGKHSNEVGELRSYVDGFIKAKLGETTKAEPEVEEDNELEFFTDPEKAVSRAIEKHPIVQQARQGAVQLQQQNAVSYLQNKHPDLPNVLQDPKFQEWVQGSKVRQELFMRADKSYDVDAADELVSNFKERQGIMQKTVEAEATTRKRQVQAATTGSASGSTQGSGGRRVYRRTDIIKLMQNDPDRYEQMADEIMAAYAEGRVK